MNVIRYGNDPKFGLFSGIHGDEWGVISSVKKAITKYKLELNSFIFIPERSPSAVKQKTRENVEGVDINRSFIKNPKCKEMKEIISILNPYTFDLCVDFHEDDELSGIYIYDSDNIEGTRELSYFRQQARRVDAITSEATILVQQRMFSDLPSKARKTTTLDNGRENHLHKRLRLLRMQAYFADPYSSWQRGTNEHGNWHLRYYFPKGTDFREISDEELQDVVDEINNRPRKILGYMSAKEKFVQLLEEARGCD